MKKIILISSTVLLFFVGSQVCGCGSCSFANAQSINSSVTKSESKTIKVKVTGMTCAGCAGHISKALNGIEGVDSVQLEYPGDVATIQFNPKKTSEEKIIKAIEKNKELYKSHLCGFASFKTRFRISKSIFFLFFAI